MWELRIELEENEDVYFCYMFSRYDSLMEFIENNERYNSDHCIYAIERVSKEEEDN